MNTQKNQWVKEHPKTTGAITLISLIILIWLVIPASPKNEATNNPVTQNQPVTFEDKLKSLSINSGSTDISFMKVEDQKADNDRPANSRMITVSYNIKSFYNKSTLMKETGQLSAKAFKEIYVNNENNYDAIIWYYADTQDRYGNVKSNIIMTNAIDKTTYNKINWDNFDSNNLCEFLRSESSRNGGETACAIMTNIK